MSETYEYKDIYITKWWDTKGILFVKGAKIIAVGPSLYYVVLGFLFFATLQGIDFCETYQEACDRVHTLAERKLKSLSKIKTKIDDILETSKNQTIKITEFRRET